MTVRRLLTLAAVIGLGISSLNAQEPRKIHLNQGSNTSSIQNQQLADRVANTIRQMGVSRFAGTKINIVAQNGRVELKGTIASDEMMKLIIDRVGQVEGVSQIVSDVQVTPAIQPIQAQSPMVPGMGMTGNGGQLAMGNPPGGAMMGGAPLGDPMPLSAPQFPNIDPNGPTLPQYSWPTYAPYPNISRVAYPQSYPHNAFPYIGPFYPFPKVPLGWRSVKLEWEDGFWYYGRSSSPYFYWRTHFW